MKTIEFLRSVLGDGGCYCVFAANAATDKRVQKFYDSLEAVAKAADHFDADGFDVYFGLGTLREAGSRKKENVVSLKSLFFGFRLWSKQGVPRPAAGGAGPTKICRGAKLT